MMHGTPSGAVKSIAPMVLALERHPPGITCMIGELTLDGVPFCHTLEDLPRKAKIPGETCIPAGTYRVMLTESNRARRGGLWCPGAERKPPNFLLPLLLSVPGFEGVRIHAGNTDKDTRGCILVGHWRGGEFLPRSRSALTSLMDMLEIAELGRRPVHIEINDANPA
jgi:hypothetical protein